MVNKSSAAKKTNIVMKNKGLGSFQEICDVDTGEKSAVQCIEEYSPHETACYKYDPQASCEVKEAIHIIKQSEQTADMVSSLKTIKCIFWLLAPLNKYLVHVL